jgi:5-formyltetrahydrofolate cyclo-ligase
MGFLSFTATFTVALYPIRQYQTALFLQSQPLKVPPGKRMTSIPPVEVESSEQAQKMNSVRKLKQTLRKEIRGKVAQLTQEEICSQSSIVWNRLYQIPEFKEAKSVGLFLSMPKGEIMTEAPCRQVLKDGKLLYVPRVGLDFEKCDMDLVRVSQSDVNGMMEDTGGMFYDSWERNKWNIPEPPQDSNHPIATPGDIDLLIVPGLGFDRLGARLGQGKGYYDRFITKMRSNGFEDKPTLVAVGLEPTFVDGEKSIPTLDHDFHMDKIILPHIEPLSMINNT